MSTPKIQVQSLGWEASSFPAQTLGFPICKRGMWISPKPE